jgi:hypothetical protein
MVFRSIPIAIALPLLGGAQQRGVDICDIVQRPESFRNKIVIVRGVFVQGRHGSTIINERCGYPNRYRAFGDGAAADAKFYDLSALPPPDLQDVIDQKSMLDFSEAVTAAREDAGAEAVVRVTVTALVKVADHYSLKKIRDDDYIGTGYGFMGRYLVGMTIFKVNSFTIKGKDGRHHARHGI